MKSKPLVLPALRGHFGDWTFYSCLFPLRELGARVRYAEEVHKDKELSRLIQRTLEGKRAERIARYLANVEERFFNSLVVATYGGDPHWLEIGNLKANVQNKMVEAVPEDAIDNLGFLYLTGREHMFAIDGQHRLAGIRNALKNDLNIQDDAVSVLLVGHKKTVVGLQRTRRLFTTLNKTAVPVKISDIIALDEDDAMAIIARRLVEEEPWFKPPRIAVVASRQLSASSHGTLTTVTHLYDVLKRLFMHDLGQTGKRSDEKLRFNRPDDARLEHYYRLVTAYFGALTETFPPLRELLTSRDPTKVTARHRNDRGGHLLFRPVGLELVTRLVIEYATRNNVSLPEAVGAFRKFPTDLGAPPFKDVIWNSARKQMQLKGKDVALNLGRHMMGLPVRGSDLLARYQAFVPGVRKLPRKLL